MQSPPYATQFGPPAQIRALFLDIDGTITGTDGLVSPVVVDAVRRAHAHGCEIVLCTGRTRFRTVPIADQLGGAVGYAVTANGGVLSHLATGTILYRHLLPIPTALDVVRTVRDAGSEPYVYEDSDLEGIDGARVLHHPEAEADAKDHADPRYRPHPELLTELPFQPVCVSSYGPAERIRPLTAILRERFGDSVSIVESGTELAWGVEIYVRGISKRTGLEAVAARLEARPEEIMAIGDHINDVEMLQWAGWGVAMGNAQPEVKAVCDWVTAPLADDGAAVAIEQFILAGPMPGHRRAP